MGLITYNPTSPGRRQLIQQQHLVGVLAGQPIGRVDVDAIHATGRRQVAQPLQGRPDQRRDVMRAIGGEQQRFRARRDVPRRVLHEPADLDAELGAAGLARAHDRAAALLEPRLQHRRLGRLAGAVAALERDEGAGHCSAAGFFAAGFFAAGFLAAGFLAAGFLAAVFRTGFLVGPFSRFSCSSSMARSKVIASTSSPRGMVAFVSPSVT